MQQHAQGGHGDARDDGAGRADPGAGALTLPFAARAERVVAVELDARLFDSLRRRAPPNLALVHGNALSVDLAGLVPAGSRLVGNLPYYVSSPLLRRFLELRSHVSDLHVLLQEEVDWDHHVPFMVRKSLFYLIVIGACVPALWRAWGRASGRSAGVVADVRP